VPVVEQRLNVQPLGGRELGAEDDRPVLPAPGFVDGETPVGAGELVLDDDVGEVRLDGRRERGDRRDTGEVTVGEQRELVVRKRIERLTACRAIVSTGMKGRRLSLPVSGNSV
jgi:hypothetical protein